MEEKKQKTFTLLVMSDASSRVRKLKISHNVLRSIFVITIIIIASGVILFSNLVLTRQKLDEKVVEIQRLEYKMQYKEVEMANLEKKTQEIETKTKILENYLKEVEELDRMVRDITGKGGYAEEVAVYTADLSADVDLDQDPNEIYYYIDDQEQELDDIEAMLDELLEVAPALSEVLSLDKQNMEDHIYLMDHTPSIWPTWGTSTGWFNERRYGHYHKGFDIGNNTGTPISATASGVVIYAGWHGSYGRKIVIYHGFGYSTVYAHLYKMNVEVGDEVEKGEVIATMGNTGNSTGPHLHYEVLVDGVPNNPQNFLP
ncbi:MAG: peptidoglycan DD-metalloendopeptidase family protein [Actinobacteria bacterium]|nr:peptidoglycan DD-metalloendopeptidase family protein [Actinomycetota bacterium]